MAYGKLAATVFAAVFVSSIPAVARPVLPPPLYKSPRDCAREYRIRYPLIAEASVSHRDFIFACLITPYGIPTAVASPPLLDSPDRAYKLGYLFTPDFLSSPQIAVPLLSGAGLPPPAGY